MINPHQTETAPPPFSVFLLLRAPTFQGVVTTDNPLMVTGNGKRAFVGDRCAAAAVKMLQLDVADDVPSEKRPLDINHQISPYDYIVDGDEVGFICLSVHNSIIF